jgi:8-oxo-dGTP diphosphatase
VLIHLVRHAVARSRRSWDEPDELRPLNEEGCGQAQRLVGQRDWSSVTRILTSPATRCVETVVPLGRTLGLEVQTEALLGEGGDPSKVTELMLCHGPGDLVLCSHGDVIPDVLRLVELRGVPVERPWRCAKASTWTIEARKGAIRGATYTPAP